MANEQGQGRQELRIGAPLQDSMEFFSKDLGIIVERSQGRPDSTTSSRIIIQAITGSTRA